MLDAVKPPKQIRRDPFGRRSLMREVCRLRSCVECGSPSRFKYEWEQDSVRIGFSRSQRSMRHALPFCGITCFDDYYRE